MVAGSWLLLTRNQSVLVREVGIEPTFPVWKTGALPLSYIRMSDYEIFTERFHFPFAMRQKLTARSARALRFRNFR
jgi:hypothetical protein